MGRTSPPSGVAGPGEGSAARGALGALGALDHVGEQHGPGHRSDPARHRGEEAGHVAPNPGGVGPMTRAMLLQNVVLAAEAALEAQPA
jgi:hypothetical protein